MTRIISMIPYFTVVLARIPQWSSTVAKELARMEVQERMTIVENCNVQGQDMDFEDLAVLQDFVILPESY